jgi:hypothetical protein
LNAVADGPRELTIDSGAGERDSVTVAIHDSGVGVPLDKLVLIFDAFYTTKSDGIGMGLAISRSIIEAHGGRIWAAANSPHGAVFRFTLPLSED